MAKRSFIPVSQNPVGGGGASLRRKMSVCSAGLLDWAWESRLHKSPREAGEWIKDVRSPSRESVGVGGGEWAWPSPNLIVPGSIKDDEAAGVIDSVPVPHPFRYFAFQTVNAAKWLEINVRERPRKAVHHLQLFPGGASALSSIHLDSSAL